MIRTMDEIIRKIPGFENIPAWLRSDLATRIPRVLFWVLLLLILYRMADLSWLIYRLTILPATEPNNVQGQIVPANPSNSLQNQALNSANISQYHIFGNALIKRQAEVVPVSAPETDLRLTLYGVFSEPNVQQGAAIIGSSPDDQKFYRVGDSISQNVTLAEVRQDHVLLSRSGKYEVLRFPKETQPISVQVNDGSSGVNAESSSGMLADKNALLENIRIVPVFDNTSKRLKGYRLIPQGNNRAAYDGLGIRPTDIVTSINGIPLDNQQEAMRVIKELYNASEMRMQVERMGKTEDITINLK